MSMVKNTEEVINDLEKVINLAKESPKASELSYEIRVSEEFVVSMRRTLKRIYGEVKA